MSLDQDVARIDNGIPLLDPNPRRFGPVSRRLLARFVAIMAVLQIAGAVLTFGVNTATSRAIGLSLTLPGGGFLYLARPVLFVLTAVLAVIALVLWWGASAHAAIPMVWLGSALAAWALVDAPRLIGDQGTTWGWAIPVVYVIAAALFATMIWKFERRFRTKRAKIDTINEYLSTVELPDIERRPRDPNEMDAELLRFCYDLAQQPDDDLTGFDWGEQLHGGTQLRYQLNAHCWALSLYAANYVPNAPAQITDALERLVVRHTDLRVWKYWRTLNVLGNFDTNPDPIIRDNIMFSAFLGDVLNIFQAATGSTRFAEEGSLTFVWKDGREFRYDHHKIVKAVEDNYARSNLGFYPCEPGWSFTVCNVMGAQSMFGHDRLYGTDMWERNRDNWQRTLEQEYLTPDGTYAHIRSTHLGLSWDTGEVPNGHYTANGTGRFADILPSHGDRARALDLRKAGPAMAGLSQAVTDGTLPMDMPVELERHRTSSTALGGWTRVIGGARLVGDEALAEAAMSGAERQCGTGKRWPERPLDAGSSAFGSHMIVRWAMPLSLADLNQRGYVAPTGPVLASTDWGRVMVTLARSDDGETLELGMQPRNDDSDSGPVELGFTQLIPNAAYRALDAAGVEHGSCVADADGCSTMSLNLDGRLRLQLVRS